MRHTWIGTTLALGALLFMQVGALAQTPAPSARPTGTPAPRPSGGGGGTASAAPQDLGPPVVPIHGGNPRGLDAVSTPAASASPGGGGGGSVMGPGFIYFGPPTNNPNTGTAASPSPSP